MVRAYHTRHGEGPFPSEDRALAERLPELHNRDDGQAGRFRVGWFDAVLARHAIAFAGPIDRLAVTCIDHVAGLPDRAVVTAWRDRASATAGDPRQRGELDGERDVATAAPVLRPVADVGVAISALLGRPIDVASHGPRAADKR